MHFFRRLGVDYRDASRLRNAPQCRDVRCDGDAREITIPIALAELIPQLDTEALIGLTAFGGGFTWGSLLVRY